MNTPTMPCTTRYKEKYVDEGGYGRERMVQENKGGPLSWMEGGC